MSVVLDAMQAIQSKENARFKQWLKCAGSMREQRKAGLLLLEGLHLLQAWQHSGRNFSASNNAVLVSETGVSRQEIVDWLAQHSLQNVFSLPDRLFNQLADAQSPSGIMAWVDYPQTAHFPDSACDAVLLDGVQDPGNLGSLLRTAAATGVKQVLLSADCCAAWSGKALRAGQGAQFALQIYEHMDLCDFLSGFSGQSIATSLENAQPIFAESAFCSSQPLAWVFGAEGSGVSAAVMNCVQQKLTVPMPGNIESLNVGAAAAICLFEMVRRRRYSERTSNESQQ